MCTAKPKWTSSTIFKMPGQISGPLMMKSCKRKRHHHAFFPSKFRFIAHYFKLRDLVFHSDERQVLFGPQKGLETPISQKPAVLLFSTAGIWFCHWLFKPWEHGCSSEAVCRELRLLLAQKKATPLDMHACIVVPWQLRVTVFFHLYLTISPLFFFFPPWHFIKLSLSLFFSPELCRDLKGLPVVFWEGLGEDSKRSFRGRWGIILNSFFFYFSTFYLSPMSDHSRHDLWVQASSHSVSETA